MCPASDIGRRRRVLSVLRELGSEIGEDRVLGLAAEIAFFTMLSLFPGLLVAAGLLSYLEVFVGAESAARVQGQVTDNLSRIFDSQASSVTDGVAAALDGRYGGLLTVAALGALFTLSGAWAVVIEALNLAYDIEEHRSWWRRRLLGLALGAATAVVVVLSLVVVVVGPLLGAGEDVADVVGLGSSFVWFWDAARLPALFVLITLWLAVVFHVAPNVSTRWRSSLPGALTTSTLWLLATLGFSLYVRVVGGNNPLLGALGGGVIFLTWVYLLSIAMLVGGEINAILQQRARVSPG
ncbi:YihY/virulence factor BrkB family protein [soil metagenome]